MIRVIDQDFETASEANLKEVGLYNYATHPSTRVLLLAYAIDDSEVKQWEPHKGPMPPELIDALVDPFTIKQAYNCTFERLIYKYVLGIDIPVDEWRDVQVMARYYSLPGYLDDVSKILKLDVEDAATSETELIKLFCEPFIDGAESPLFGHTEAAFRDWRTHPLEWERFKTYNIRDVRAEIAIAQKLKNFPVPEHEWRYWFMDQHINDAGLPVDMNLVDGALKVVAKEQDKLERELKELTGVENANSDQQILAWVRERGYPFSKIGKPFVKRALGGEGNLTEEARAALVLRSQLSKSGVDKFSVFRTMTGKDGNLRYQFSFMGASRTGRYASRGINIQNLTRPDPEVNNNLDVAIDLLTKGDYDGIQKTFKASVLDVASSCIRPVFRAPTEQSQILAISDLNAIEPRVSAWISGCETVLDIYRNGLDGYKMFAVEVFKKPYEEITKEERNLCKPPFLGCSYRLSGGEEIINSDGIVEYTGLLAYSRAMGIELTKEFADKAVAIFRKKYKEIKYFWYTLEDAFKAAVLDHEEVNLGKITFKMVDNTLCMGLPSGRNLHYINPQVYENVTMQGKNGEYTKTRLTHEGLDKNTLQWSRQETHGGVLIENATQAIARDVLMEGMRRAQEAGLDIRGHVHDECIGLIAKDSGKSYKDLEKAMSDPIHWAEDLPLKAEGFENITYRKN